MGYVSAIDDGVFTLALDVRTFGDAVGINVHYLPLDGIEIVGNTPSSSFAYQGINYTTNYYLDPVYPGMDPIYCIHNDSEIPIGTGGQSLRTESVCSSRALCVAAPLTQLCFIEFGNSSALPLFMPYGESGSDYDAVQTPRPCWWYVLRRGR